MATQMLSYVLGKDLVDSRFCVKQTFPEIFKEAKKPKYFSPVEVFTNLSGRSSGSFSPHSIYSDCYFCPYFIFSMICHAVGTFAKL